MLLPELQALASSMGIAAGKLRKSDLIAAIENAGRPNGSAPATGRTASTRTATARAEAQPAAQQSDAAPAAGIAPVKARTRRSAARPAGPAQTTIDEASPPVQPAPQISDSNSAGRADSTETGAGESGRTDGRRNGQARDGQTRSQNDRDGQTRTQNDRDGQTRTQNDRDGQSRSQNDRDGQTRTQNDRDGQTRSQNDRDGQTRSQNDRDGQFRDGQNRNQSNRNQNNRDNQSQSNRQNEDDDDFGGSRRGRRYRDRRGRTRDRFDANSGGRTEAEPTISDDDVLVPVAGILDAVEDKNTWFIRTAGYFASPEDVYVANSHVRRFGLRRGDAVTGMVRQPKEGERKEKFNPLVRLDTVNGVDPEQAKNRVEFTKLTPLYPQDRLRLETEPHILTTRVIDLVMPIGKGQRALIVSPPKAGKTSVLQALANAIAVNNPECHLMVVLVDERPEEVTDMQRSVKGEVIASTFDRRPQDHTMIAELSIERAKRLVEMGHDVVVLLDSITRLGRAYNLAAPASGRILSGGVDSTALYPPKRFLGAARNIEDGGSLTIIATALVETGSTMDTVIFEEFKGTGNAELILDRKIADKRVFPAVNVDTSGTRKEEILMAPDELAVVLKLRRVLHALDPQQGIDLLLDRLKKSRTNIEFLMQIAKTAPGGDDR